MLFYKGKFCGTVVSITDYTLESGIDSVCGTALYRSLSENEIKSLIYGFLDCFSHLGDCEGRNLYTCVATTNEIVAYAKMKFGKTE